MTTLYTIGYQGRTLDEYIQLLRKHGIKLLVDVRYTPRSRARGFSKGPLSHALTRAGIDYVHLPALGVETMWRRKVGPGFSRADLFDRYKKVNLKRSKEDQHQLMDLLEEHAKLAITCVERDPDDCHRSHLARALARSAKKPFRTIHL
jgi:uncharacterized protein (DUF488 family)